MLEDLQPDQIGRQLAVSQDNHFEILTTRKIREVRCPSGCWTLKLDDPGYTDHPNGQRQQHRRREKPGLD
jgi:hypothetical protein